MDITDVQNATTNDFQREATEFLQRHAPERREGDKTMFMVDEEQERDFVARGRAWQRTKYDHGFAGISWPKEVGGLGMTALENALFKEVEHRYVSQWLTHNLGFDNIGPAIIQHGSDSQRDKFTRPMLRGEQVWTLLMSEPNAGSDLGALRMRAVQDGEEWIVNGQKVWSSRAHLAEYGLLFARSNPDVPKYRGITAFLLDMSLPGITVRPLRQMNRSAHFNEVFLTDVRVPADAVIGEVDHGWAVAKTTLSAERNLLGSVRSHISMADLFALVTRMGAIHDPIVRQRVADAYISDTILRLHGGRIRSATLAGNDAASVASVMKLGYALHVTRTTELALDVLGAGGMLSAGSADNGGRWEMEFTGAPATRIGGGTDEIQRNTVGEKVLGLPSEPRDDRTLPFRELRS